MIIALGRTDSYLQRSYEHNRRKALVFLLSGIFLMVLGGTVIGGFSPSWEVIVIVLGLASLAISWNYLKRSLNYRAGMEGERAVVEALYALDDNYCLVNDVVKSGRGGNIDHVLLGPHAVFAIETKNYSGDIRCNGDQWRKKGRRRLYPIDSVSKQAQHNAKYLYGLISKKTNIRAPVIPICVFTNPSVDLKLRKPTVKVLRLHELVAFVQEAEPLTHLSALQTQAIVHCILEEPGEKT